MQSPVRSALAAALAFAALPLAVHASPDAAVQVRQDTANVQGTWCGAGLLSGFTLQIAQQLQNFEARLVRKTRVREVTGHIEGTILKVDPQRDHTMELLAQGNELRIIGATGVLAMARGQFFTRALGGSCTS